MVSVIRTLRHHTDEISCCAFSPRLLATCSGDKSLRVYRADDLSELPCSPLTGHSYGVHCCRFSSCGQHLLSCSTDGCALVWSPDAGEVTATLHHPARSPLRACALAPDSSLALAGASDGTVALWELPSKTLRRCCAVSEASVVACCFSPCGQMVATGCTHGDLKLWDVDLSLLLTRKDAHDLGVTCCSFAPQFKVGDDCCVEFRLASCGQDSQLKIWIVSQRDGAVFAMKLLYTLTGQSAPVLCCDFSSDGELVVSGSVDKSVAVYDANQGTLLHTLRQHDGYVTAVALSPASPWIATGSMDRSVNVWRIADGDGRSAAESKPTLCQGRKLPRRSGLLLAGWTEEDVQDWLREEGLAELVGVFAANNMDGPELLQLNKQTAAELGIGTALIITPANGTEPLFLTSGRHFAVQAVCTDAPRLDGHSPRRTHTQSKKSMGLRGRLLRKIEALKAAEGGSEAPHEFLCPITTELMKDPVIAADGFSYERESIESWIRGKNRSSPMTNLPLQTTLLTPNRSLKMAITRWKFSRSSLGPDAAQQVPDN